MFANTSKVKVGPAAELYASAILMGWGFLVYRNLSPHGEHDLVLMQEGSFKALPVDITIGRWRKNKTSDIPVLASSASCKLSKGQKHTVIIVAETGELYLANNYRKTGDIRYAGEVAVDVIPLSPGVILERFGALK